MPTTSQPVITTTTTTTTTTTATATTTVTTTTTMTRAAGYGWAGLEMCHISSPWYVFSFSFFVLNTLLINIYRWTAVAQAINHHYHPKTMKGAQDADMSRAQVCIFFFLSFF